MSLTPQARIRTATAAAAAAAVVALVAFLPFLRGVLSGRCFFFRDLSLQFFPQRRFAVEGLRAGELRFWNPYVHEGVPLPLLPLSYPLDILQALLPDEHGFSLLLALHVPFAALSFLLLARGLGLGRVAAAGGASVYALGGFTLSSLNLYVYLQAVAWAPLVVLGLIRAGTGGRREVGIGALLLAVAVSTTGVEVVAQAVLFGLVLAFARREPRRWVRLGSSLVLGGGLAAWTILLVSGLVPGSERGRGFAPEVVLAHSVHPLTFVQVVVAGFYGDLSSLAGRFWGQNFFPRGFPYLLSLYLGATVLGLAAVGAVRGRQYRGRLLALLVAGAVLCLGRWAGLETIVAALPGLFRYPSKAFFTVHLAIAALVALGLEALVRERRGWRLLAAAAGALGGALVAAPWIPSLLPGPVRWFVAGFFPPEYPPALRLERLRFMLDDALRGGLPAVAAALLAGLVLARRLDPARAGLAVTALAVADLLRAGAGLNPMVTPSFYEPSAETKQAAPLLREGRVFTCDLDQSPAYHRARAARGDEHEVWTFLVAGDTLTPNFNLRLGVPTALSPDLTMLVPRSRLLSWDEGGCRDFESIVDRVRAAGVSHVLSLDPLSHPDLRPLLVAAPPRIAPLVVHVYELARALPRSDVAGGRVLAMAQRPGRIEIEVEAGAGSVVVVREAEAPGWRATVDGSPAPVLREAGRHLGVSVPAGRRRVSLVYSPPGLRPGLLLTLAAAAVTALLLRPRRRSAGAAPRALP